VKPYDNMVTFESMFVGFAETLNLLDDAGDDVILAFNAVFEALNWAVALDERVGEHWVPDGTPLRRDWRARLGPEAELMAGIRFARNRIHHQWSDVMFPSVTPSGDFRAWMWRPVEDLPAGRADAHGEEIYRAHLQGSQVPVAKRRRRGISRSQGMLEPHTVRYPAATNDRAI
jgi:hypothetical protein